MTSGEVVESFFCVANVLRRGVLVTLSHLVVHSPQDSRAVLQKQKQKKTAVKLNVDSNGETKPKQSLGEDIQDRCIAWK